MGATRNGARSALRFLHQACKMSRLPGFRLGITQILGATDANSFFLVWDPMCAFVEILVGQDQYYNQIDLIEERAGSEDLVVV